MSELYTALPYSIEYKGRTYRLRPFFDVVLEVLDTLNRKDLTGESVIEYCLWLLVDEKRYPLDGEFLDEILTLLVKRGKSDHPRSIDMRQDAELIYSAFRQAYNIDLHKEQLHWSEFVSLLGGLPSDTRLMEVVQIRTRPVPKPTKYNADEIRELMRLKAIYRIKLTDEEADEQYRAGLNRLAQNLINQAIQ